MTGGNRRVPRQAVGVQRVGEESSGLSALSPAAGAGYVTVATGRDYSFLP